MSKATLQCVFVMLAWVFASLPGSAQSLVSNPKLVEFDPSADQSAVTSGGQPVVQRYDLQFYLQGATAPMTTVSLGKPSPDSDGKIRVDFSTLLVAWPLASGTYDARVAAVGPAGSGLSDPSNLFTFGSGVTCSYTVSSSSLSVLAAGGSSGMAVTASDSSCGWTAASDSAWAVVSPVSGTGTGTVTVTVAANTGVARTATLTLGGQTVTVAQAAVPCSQTLSSSGQSFGASGGSASVTVTSTLPTCGWTTSSGSTWATVSPASGTGTGSVAVAVGVNAGVARTASLTLAGQAFAVTQAAAACSFSLSSSSQNFAFSGGTGNVAVATNLATCGWTASSSATWLTVSPASGTGGGTVTFVAAANTGSARSATITIGGQTFTVTQDALVCSFTLSPASLSVAATGGSGSLDLGANSPACAWTAVRGAGWMIVSPTSGTGSASLAWAVSRNTTASARIGTIVAGGQTITVTQAAAKQPGQPKGVKLTLGTGQ